MNNANVKGIAGSALGYTGVVTLSQYSKGRKITKAKLHNAGGRPLFNFLADCLVEDFDIARLDSPSKILLLKCEKDGNRFKNISKCANTGFISRLSKPEKVYSDIAGIVRYSFIIPQEFFVGTDFNAIGLYSKSASTDTPDDYAAIVDVDLSNVTLSISSVLVLDWELHISNLPIDKESYDVS